MKIYLSSSYVSSFRKLTKNNLPLKLKIKSKISLFKEYPRHPGLKLHKLEGGLHDKWSFSVTGEIRILLMYEADGVMLVKIGKHKDVY